MQSRKVLIIMLLLLGIFIGAPIGFMVFALCHASSDADQARIG